MVKMRVRGVLRPRLHRHLANEPVVVLCKDLVALWVAVERAHELVQSARLAPLNGLHERTAQRSRAESSPHQPRAAGRASLSLYCVSVHPH
jgi:hypothetical protein